MKSSLFMFINAAAMFTFSMIADSRYAIALTGFAAGWCAAFGIATRDLEEARDE